MNTLQDLKKKYYGEFEKELFEYCAPFWLKYGKDDVNGGIINCLDREGKVFSEDKSVWMQGRCGWMYSHLNNLFGENKEYLDFAKSCIDFENAHCFDKDGRMYFKVTIDGKPLRKRRYWFSESFYIVACAEYYMATGDEKCLKDAVRVYDMVWSIFENPANDPFKIFPKTYPETRQLKPLADPMILLNVSSIMRRADKARTAVYDAHIDVCLKEIKTHYFADKKAMLENVTPDNKYLGTTADGRIVNPGHDMECAFFLAQEADYRGDKELLSFAETVFKDAFARGWDSEYEGIFYFKDVENRPVEAYEHDMKLWWPHNEGMNASLLLLALTGKAKYAEIFEKITEYAFEHFSDRKYGEWYGYLRRDGKPTEPACKGCTYKGPFHVMRCLSTVLAIFDGKKDF